MRELDPLISEYAHEKQLPRETEALHTIQKIASLVKPIMRARNWRVGTLAEFYPAQSNLLGLNVNRGEKILLRLRYPGDVKQFLPLEQVVDTMLHELSHIVYGPHDDKFHALWNQLREEHEGLIRKGYTGEGFLSEGKKLGGRRIPRDEARRIARNAAEKRRNLSSGSGQKLGGAPVRAGTDIRDVIVNAIERRATITKGCGSEGKNEREIREIADQAARNGFKTKAEEDEANERAISEAYWDLVQEDERKKYGGQYIPPSAANPTGNGGGRTFPPGLPAPDTKPPDRSASTPQNSMSVRPTPNRATEFRPLSRLVQEQPSRSRPSSSALRKPSEASSQASKPAEMLWECPMCTCHNPVSFLCCDACTAERPSFTVEFDAPAAAPVPSKPTPSTTSRSTATAEKSQAWTCHMCSTRMENKWWTCSTCGTLKLSS